MYLSLITIQDYTILKLSDHVEHGRIGLITIQDYTILKHGVDLSTKTVSGKPLGSTTICRPVRAAEG